ncbi:hypothetical protein [Verrucosispora sp. NA02020]|uniref:hypothetical protein n=1 Tax=Verrucosispora sp. NA02020 TaxID=2742132 RepID=UPI003D763158
MGLRVSRRRTGGLAAVVLVSALLALATAGPARAAAPADTPTPATTGSATTRYYVVGATDQGAPEFLYQIAARTLGDGNRFREIFDLNRDRLQPDGARLTDPLVLREGWLLELPADADGPGVTVGPLPEVTEPAGSVGEAPAAGPPPNAPDPDGLGGFLFRLAAFGVMVMLLAIVLWMLRRGRPGTSQADTAPIGEPPAPRVRPERSPVPRPQATGASGPPTAAVVVPADTAAPVTVPASAPDRRTAVPPPVPASVGLTTEVGPSPGRTILRPDSTSAPDLTDGPDTTDAPDRPSGPAVTSGGPASTAPGPIVASSSRDGGDQRLASGPPESAVRPRPESGTSGYTKLRTDLDDASTALRVQLVGAAGPSAPPAYAWLADDEQLTGARVPVRLGHRDGWGLWVDLARTPDVLTVTGDPVACRQRAASLARQLLAADVDVMVVGDALGADPPPGARWLDEFPLDMPDPGSTAAVVFSGGLRGARLRAARRMAADSGGAVVPVLTGEVLRARWSIVVEVPTPTEPVAPTQSDGGTADSIAANDTAPDDPGTTIQP